MSIMRCLKIMLRMELDTSRNGNVIDFMPHIGEW